MERTKQLDQLGAIMERRYSNQPQGSGRPGCSHGAELRRSDRSDNRSTTNPLAVSSGRLRCDGGRRVVPRVRFIFASASLSLPSKVDSERGRSTLPVRAVGAWLSSRFRVSAFLLRHYSVFLLRPADFCVHQLRRLRGRAFHVTTGSIWVIPPPDHENTGASPVGSVWRCMADVCSHAADWTPSRRRNASR